MNMSLTKLVVSIPKTVAMVMPLTMFMTPSQEMNSLNSLKNLFIHFLSLHEIYSSKLMMYHGLFLDIYPNDWQAPV